MSEARREDCGGRRETSAGGEAHVVVRVRHGFALLCEIGSDRIGSDRRAVCLSRRDAESPSVSVCVYRKTEREREKLETDRQNHELVLSQLCVKTKKERL